MGKTVGLTYDLRSEYVLKEGDPPDAHAEFDHPDTVGVIREALESAGHRVVSIGNAYELLKRHEELSVDIVFNIAEGQTGRNRESQIPIILEMLGIPFVGADGLSLGLTLDKVMAKKVLISENVPTPNFIEVNDAKNLNGVNLRYPLIVKPRYEGSSKGLSDSSLVTNVSKLKKQTGWVIDTYKQPALVEEFIEGREFTVAILGNREPEALPVVQIKIEGKLDLGSLFYTFSRITSDTNIIDYVCPAPIPKKLEKKLKSVAVKAYRAVDCRDFGRVDIRLDDKQTPYVLEINPLPSLSTEDVFSVVAKYLGMSYNEMINKILNVALERHGI